MFGFPNIFWVSENGKFEVEAEHNASQEWINSSIISYFRNLRIPCANYKMLVFESTHPSPQLYVYFFMLEVFFLSLGFLTWKFISEFSTVISLVNAGGILLCQEYYRLELNEKRKRWWSQLGKKTVRAEEIRKMVVYTLCLSQLQFQSLTLSWPCHDQVVTIHFRVFQSSTHDMKLFSNTFQPREKTTSGKAQPLTMAYILFSKRMKDTLNLKLLN